MIYMKLTIFLIPFLVILAFAKQPLWPKTLIQSVDSKSFAEVCASVNYCKDKKNNDPATFKVTVKNESTLMLSYKNSIVPISYKAGTTLYKINNKALDLKSLVDINEILQEVLKKLPNGTQFSFSSLWLEPAYAQSTYPSYELGMALTKLMVENQEAKICEQADIVKIKCDPFINLVPKGSPSQTDDLATTLKNNKKLLSDLKTLNGQLTHYTLLFTTAMKHKEVLNKCEKLASMNLCQKSLEKAKAAFASYKSPEQIEKELDEIETALENMGQAYSVPPITLPPAKEKGFR